jgi:hypothetical protein
MYDKNLLQSNGFSEDCEIPNDGYFASGRIPISGDAADLRNFPIFAPSNQ